ncbi:ArsR/SmtB family transcription factor [Psychromonas sp. Urea-02u-13]|uniref:ArsR/SmtB family transcription factor n=1 Tax=Psychromonas sp. Urea-02u-13 TaxID=2058326 RepID=UPI000C32CF35|nr:helix-turn-helix domain-containing protein [Psychromonas sp. Urea-02u-13]PKG40925.1 transcriptional regulator [Psychromonas sp. Urea-02u-13]
MDNLVATGIFESLSSGVRLDCWRLLVKAGNQGKVAGELAQLLEVAPNTLSFHLKAMLHSNLVSVTKEGRYLRYRANLPMMLDLISYMSESCCSDESDNCHANNINNICPDADEH